MSIKAYANQAKDAVLGGLHAIENGAKKVGSAIVNGKNVVVQNLSNAAHAAADAATNRGTQDLVLSTARNKLDALAQAGLDNARKGLDKAENFLKADAYNTLNKVVDVSPVVKALENAELEFVDGESSVKAAAKKGFNALLSYHQKTLVGGEKAARKAFSLTYIATKYLLSPLSFFRAGRVAQEAISLALATIARAVTTVAAAIVFALPELIALGAVATAATFAGFGIAAGGAIAASTIGALKISGYVLAGLAAAGYVARREIQIHQLNKNVEKLAQAISVQLEEKIETRSFYNPARYIPYLQGTHIPFTSSVL